MLTLKGSVLGIAAFFVTVILLGSFKMYLVSSAFRKSHPGTTGQVGWDLVTMYHNNPWHRDPLFWIVVIVFMTAGSWFLRR